jgi:hypothetical protein
MSSAPQTLVDLRKFLADQYDVPAKNFGIRGTCTARRPWGYHLGKADIFGDCGKKRRDYSIQYRRDRLGLTEASAGFDIKLPIGKLKALCAYLVQQGRSGYQFGGKTLIVEVLGPDQNGVAKRWARDTNWLPVDARDDHEWHIHVSFYRDTEFISKLPLFARHLGVDLEEPVEPEEPPIEPPDGGTPPPVDPEQPPVDPIRIQLADAEDALREADLAIDAYLDKYVPEGDE